MSKLTLPTYCFPLPVHSSKRKKLFHIHPRLERWSVRPSLSAVLNPGTGRSKAELHSRTDNSRTKVSWLVIIVSYRSWRVLDKESISVLSVVWEIQLNANHNRMGHPILSLLFSSLVQAWKKTRKDWWGTQVYIMLWFLFRIHKITVIEWLYVGRR